MRRFGQLNIATNTTKKTGKHVIEMSIFEEGEIEVHDKI